MSWIDRIKQDMVIKTGDGKEYRPMWFNANYIVNYNVADFDFRKVQGTLWVRGTSKGRVYDLEIVFQGADCLDIGDAFKKSADNSAPWSLFHPKYGTLNVQPSTLKWDNSAENITRITGVIMETIQKAPVAVTVAPEEKVIADAAVVVDTANERFAEEAPVLSASTLSRIHDHIQSVYEQVSVKIANVQASVDAYTDAYYAANSVLNTGIYDTTDIIEATADLIATPYRFANTVQERLDMFATQLSIFEQDIADIAAMGIGGSAVMKRLYENNAGAAITGMCNTTVTNVNNDYAFRPTVLNIVSQIIVSYNAYLNNLCGLQTENNGDVESYIPDAGTITRLSQLVYYATANLYNIATSAKQQRFYIVPYDTNLIDITNDLYGMQKDDSTLFTLIDSNNIGLNEHLIIKQGRELVYFV
jgi:hypothetical protein